MFSFCSLESLFIAIIPTFHKSSQGLITSRGADRKFNITKKLRRCIFFPCVFFFFFNSSLVWFSLVSKCEREWSFYLWAIILTNTFLSLPSSVSQKPPLSTACGVHIMQTLSPETHCMLTQPFNLIDLFKTWPDISTKVPTPYFYVEP